MLRLEQILNTEKAKLDRLILLNNDGLLNDLILEQSRKVDRFIVIFQNLQRLSIKRELEYKKKNKESSERSC